MSCLWTFSLILLVVAVIFVIGAVVAYKADIDWLFIVCGIVFSLVVVVGLVLFCFAIAQPFVLKREAMRQEKEREQILYQKSILTTESDKVKLNEWILTYNDWVNDINTDKEMYGWFSWYYNFDMSGHKIIDLV